MSVLARLTTLALLLPTTVSAAPATTSKITIPVPPAVGNSKFGSVTEIIRNGFSITITVAGVVFVLLFLIGGMMYLTAAGNEESTKKSRALMLDAVIGLGIVVMTWAVGLWVLQVLGLGNGTTLNI